VLTAPLALVTTAVRNAPVTDSAASGTGIWCANDDPLARWQSVQ
jgi:hypothetical protein